MTSEVMERSKHLAAKAVERIVSEHIWDTGRLPKEGVWWEYLVVLLMYMREEDSEMGTIIVSMANFVLWEIRVSTMQLQ